LLTATCVPVARARPHPRRYLLNVKFNILNKQIYNILPYPWCGAARSVARLQRKE
jgi:hypothetical protein